jgi:tRNA dimethylallyltransferase
VTLQVGFVGLLADWGTSRLEKVEWSVCALGGRPVVGPHVIFMKSKVIVILGPTASGKSDLGVRLAKKFKGEIISADSRQVYKGLNIGSGKITRKEMRGVKHHLLDVVEPKKQFSVAQYQTLGQAALEQISLRNKLPIIVGGTGFYIDALAGGIVLPEVPPNKKLRAKLAKRTNASLFSLIRKKDPKRAKTLDPNNKVRLIRALEIIEALGKVPQLTSKLANNFVYIGIKPADLDRRIRLRLEKRLTGMITEGRKLHAKSLSYKRMNELGLEYRYVSLYLQGKLSKEEMRDKLFYAIRQYAQRQMAWFRRNRKIKWFDPKEFKKIEKYIRTVLR